MAVSELSRNSCRLCLSESDFNVSLFGYYARRTNMIEKIRVCLQVVIHDGDLLTTICYQCAGNVERYYDFTTVINRSQNRLKFKKNERHLGLLEESFNRRVRYVREEVVDADCTFSFLKNVEEKKEESSNHLFYMSPPKVIAKKETDVWKLKRRFSQDIKFQREVKSNKKVSQKINRSPDFFETQSQEEEEETNGLDWKLTQDNNLMKRIEEEVFGRSK